MTSTDWNPPGPGPWKQDAAHTPDARTAVMSEVYPEGFDRGFGETFSRYGLLLDRLAMAVVNGFTYLQPQPFDLPGPDGPMSDEQIGAEIGRRAEIAERVFATKQWRADLRLWDEELKPASIERHRELFDVSRGILTDAQVADHLDECAEHVGEMVYQHHRMNVAALLPVGDFALHVAGWVGCDPTTVFGVLDGYSPVSGVASDELQPTLDAVRSDPHLRAILDSGDDAAKRMVALRQACGPFDDFIRTAGCRLLDGFDVTSPTLIERPELFVHRLEVALDVDADAAFGRSDARAAELRAQVPEEHRGQFDDLLVEARAVYRLRDERGLYSDMSGIGLLRLAMLEAGRRLVALGKLRDHELALDATVAELTGLLRDGNGPSEADLRDRRDVRIARSAAGAPPLLGPPPPAPPPVDQLPPALARLMSAVGFTIEGILGQLDAPVGDDAIIGGIPASAGTYEGRARIVQTIDDLFDLEPGDVLVTPSTGEAFNSMLHLVGAIVTDHGSFACHAGIVSREMGIPAVVGTVDGSRRITDGSRIRVDGTTGEVRVIG